MAQREVSGDWIVDPHVSVVDHDTVVLDWLPGEGFASDGHFYLGECWLVHFNTQKESESVHQDRAALGGASWGELAGSWELSESSVRH